MNRLTLLLAWLAPLWFIGHFIEQCNYYKLCIQFDSFKGKWCVRVGRHHYSRSSSLRRALFLALRKVDPSQPAANKDAP